MIKANELRLGNFLDRNGLIEVKFIGMEKIRIYDHVNKHHFKISFRPDEFKGMPLTEEWLIKLGFIKQSVIWHDKSISESLFIKGRYFIEFTTEGIVFAEIYSDGGFKRNHFVAAIKYVHRLQNLYYALTSTELTPKD